MHICTVTIAIVHKCTILHRLMWVFFRPNCVKGIPSFYFAKLSTGRCNCFEHKEILRIFSTSQGSKSARTNLLFHPFPYSNKIKNSQLHVSAKFVEVQLVLLAAGLYYLVKKDPLYMNAPLRSTLHMPTQS